MIISNEMNFNFSTSQQIIFGLGKISVLPILLQDIGKKIFILRTKSGAGFNSMLKIVETIGIDWVDFEVNHEPDLNLVSEAILLARKNKCDCVISIGGGSVIDTGKFVAIMMTNHGDVINYLEVIGKGESPKNPALPHIAIPTTAGTGSEVTRNAVLGVPELKIKISMRSNFLFPKIACVDPELTFSVPPTQTAFSGMDAFIQVIEPFVSKKNNQFTDLFCREGIRLAPDSLISAFKDGSDRVARTNMSWVSLLGGLCLTNSGLGAVHGFAGPIGGMYQLPHGAICAALLPAVMEVNIKVMKIRETNNQAINRYKEIFRIVTKNPHADIAKGIEWFKEFNSQLNIPTLSILGISQKQFAEIIDRATQSSSMKGNPIQLTRDDLHEILELAL